jgi:hypothetical protein
MTDIRFILCGCSGALLAAMLLADQVEAGIIRAATVSLTDVRTAINLAHDGDTVALPAGEASWTQPLIIAKPITLQGETVVTGGFATWMSAMANTAPVTYTPPISRKTIIHHAVVSGGKPLIQLLPSGTSTGLWRVTGISFLPPSSGSSSGTCISPQAGVSNFRVDHCEFDGLAVENIWAWSERGLVDHNVSVHGTQIFFHHKPMAWGSGNVSSLGDGSWAAPTDAGNAGGNASKAERKIYLEDNFFRAGGGANGLSGASRGYTDGESGARFVARFNIGFSAAFENHGAEVSFNRSGRLFEIYNNQLYSRDKVTKGAATYWRGGTGFIFNNALNKANSTATSYGSIGNAVNYRAGSNDSTRSWGVISGKNGWDLNDPSMYKTGQTTAADPTDTIQSGANFPNYAPGYVAFNKTGYEIRANKMAAAGAILSNTSTVLNLYTYLGSHDWRVGDTYEIRKVLRALDQCGAGQDGEAISPQSRGSRPNPKWPKQAMEPIYVWRNTLNGGTTDLGGQVTIKPNVDFFNENRSYSGGALTQGIAVGTLAQRPATCSPGVNPAGGNAPGVGYWATDQGEWNSAHSGPDGQLYVCTTPNAWTLYYTPYTYPHPLTSGTSSPPPSDAPSPPTNLKVVP